MNKHEKLFGNLNDEDLYVDHTRYLQQGLNYGMKLKKFHRFLNSINIHGE